ncbi:hypothetical protein A4R35_23600 [Thermogemmatispora tikiterensis]|uniref:Carbohydrate kinase FGGY C-terminal domain-containing protein n=2 Tax=Thermogemmatispora tikiterensis TaxID=1825093 RepID=A0A328VAY8_9CHLR|nr:hypothetical protein A4R35_23600 [Thermogemmatispora tikiterensis]
MVEIELRGVPEEAAKTWQQLQEAWELWRRWQPGLEQDRLEAGEQGQRLGHERRHLLHAALEGVAFGMRLALESPSEGEEDGRLLAVGGGSLCPGWQQMLADILGRELWAVAERDTALRGAALLAGLVAGYWEDATALAAWRSPVLTVTAPGAHEPCIKSTISAIASSCSHLRLPCWRSASQGVQGSVKAREGVASWSQGDFVLASR